MADLKQLLGRTLVIVAHADDEAVACGALLQRMREATVVICTDGAPRDEYFWHAYGSREEYARVRAAEARAAASAVGVKNLVLLAESVSPGDLVDQELFRRLPLAAQLLRQVAHRVGPEAILTIAYEGGHPDHDTCSFLAHQLAGILHVPVWESPLYHRADPSRLVTQRFVQETGRECRIQVKGSELDAKRAMFAAYRSQGDVLATFDATLETVRPLAAYDYSRPPHQGTLNYEAWGWPTRGNQLCEEFARYLTDDRGNAVRASEARSA